MRHEDATRAISTVREWFGGALSNADHVDGQLARIISAILEAKQLSDWLHDNASWNQEDSQRESVELLWAVVRACDLKAIREAIDTAKQFADEVKPQKSLED